MTLRKLIRNWLLEAPSDQTAQERSAIGEDASVLLIYTNAKEALAAERAELNSLETKAGTLIIFAGGIFALLMGAIETLILLPRTSQILILISVVLFAMSVILAFEVTQQHLWRYDPNPKSLADNYLDKPAPEIQLQLISNLNDSWEANLKVIKHNGEYLRYAFQTQTVAFILLGVALFVSFL